MSTFPASLFRLVHNCLQSIHWCIQTSIDSICTHRGIYLHTHKQTCYTDIEVCAYTLITCFATCTSEIIYLQNNAEHSLHTCACMQTSQNYVKVIASLLNNTISQQGGRYTQRHRHICIHRSVILIPKTPGQQHNMFNTNKLYSYGCCYCNANRWHKDKVEVS